MENGDAMIDLRFAIELLTEDGSRLRRALITAIDELEAGRALFDELDMDKDDEPKPEAQLYRNARLSFDRAKDGL